MPVYSMSFVICWEHRWFEPPTDPALARRSQWEPDGTHITELQPARIEREWSLETILYECTDAAAAFDRATRRVAFPPEAIRGDMSDLTVTRCIGIHDIERIPSDAGSLERELHPDLGVDVATLTAYDFGADGWPLVRTREQLSIFR